MATNPDVEVRPALFDETVNQSFPGWPKLRRVVHSRDRGRIELLSVDETSDGFLIGQAQIGEGPDAYCHSVFIGSAADFR